MPARHDRERRSETRYLCSDLVTLRWSDNFRRERAEVVILENISASGASVQADVEVAESTPVRMLCHKCELRGLVRSCYQRENAYFIGIEFDSDSTWSKAKFKPKHLLDPREVKPRHPASKPWVMLVAVGISAA
jgi:PilZ domain-containing protein